MAEIDTHVKLWEMHQSDKDLEWLDALDDDEEKEGEFICGVYGHLDSLSKLLQEEAPDPTNLADCIETLYLVYASFGGSSPEYRLGWQGIIPQALNARTETYFREQMKQKIKVEVNTESLTESFLMHSDSPEILNNFAKKILLEIENESQPLRLQIMSEKYPESFLSLEDVVRAYENLITYIADSTDIDITYTAADIRVIVADAFRYANSKLILALSEQRGFGYEETSLEKCREILSEKHLEAVVQKLKMLAKILKSDPDGSEI